LDHHIFKYNQAFELESGAVLPSVQIYYSTWGTYRPEENNVVWICHALTANSDAASWWEGIVGEHQVFNPEKHFIVCANIIGSCYGSSGPLDINPQTKRQYFLDFPMVTIRDMVNAHVLLRQHLGIEHINLLVGGSLGGQQALEWAILENERFDNFIVMATNAFHSPWGIALNETQRMAIAADPTWRDENENAGREGLKAARAIAFLSYRNFEAYQKTQSETDIEKIDHYRASSYQQHQGTKLVSRFNCHAYYYLTKALDSHHVGRGRGGAEKALSLIKARTLVVGISSDILFPVEEQQFIAQHIPNAEYKEIDSFYGHDGFLTEAKAITELFKAFFAKIQTQVKL
jgi:homoserine O-acetyltransferase/O-succinyltransferase